MVSKCKNFSAMSNPIPLEDPDIKTFLIFKPNINVDIYLKNLLI